MQMIETLSAASIVYRFGMEKYRPIIIVLPDDDIQNPNDDTIPFCLKVITFQILRY